MISRPDWHAFALCRGKSALFFGDGQRETKTQRREREQLAKAFCDVCPVQEPCLRAGLQETLGVWGKMSTEERRRNRPYIIKEAS